jgi:hypothetical protein
VLAHHSQDSKGFDGWSLKKSIINTLLQAVKAIAGGVTTLKGQLIKGSGYVVQQKGKVSSNPSKIQITCHSSKLLFFPHPSTPTRTAHRIGRRPDFKCRQEHHPQRAPREAR